MTLARRYFSGHSTPHPSLGRVPTDSLNRALFLPTEINRGLSRELAGLEAGLAKTKMKCTAPGRLVGQGGE